MPTIICSHCSEVVTVEHGPVPIICPSCGKTLRVEGDVTRTGGALPSTVEYIPEPLPANFERYIVLKRIGGGGFGIVYLARDPQLDCPVAIKTPRPGPGTTKHALERFEREGRSAARLRHPGIVSILNVGHDGRLPFLVCEYVEGQTLSDRVKEGPIPFREVARIVAEVAIAVNYAHTHGVIHRDIKPSNIMLCDDGKPRLMDFGLAKRDVDLTITHPNAILGTPAYMSPEQARGGDDERVVNERSDVYSLGATLYNLLTRDIPFHGEPRAVLRQVIEDEPKNPRSLNAEIPPDLEVICQKAMRKESTGRYKSAGALAADLQRWLDGRPIEARPVTRIERSWRWCRRNPITAGLVGTIAALFVIVAFSATAMFAMERQHRITLEEALLENNRLLSKAYVERANRYMDPIGPVDQYRPLQGLPWLYAALQIDDNDPTRRDASRLRLGAALRSMPSVETVWVHHGGIKVAAASANGEWLFTGGNDGSGHIWKCSDDHVRRRVLVHPAAVTAAQFSPDGKLLVTGCWDGCARLWNTANCELLAGPLRDAKFTPGTSAATPVISVRFSRDGHLFATCRLTAVQIWEAPTGRAVGQTVLLSALPSSVDFANGDALLVTPCFDSSILVWNIQTGKEKYRFRSASRTVPAVADVSPDGTIIAGNATQETVVMWNSHSGKKLELSPLVHGSTLKEVRFSRDGRFLATGTDDGTVYVWNRQDARLVWKNRIFAHEVDGMHFANHSPRFAVEARDEGGSRRISVLDTNTGSLIAEPIALPGGMQPANWVGETDALATSSGDGTVRVWRTESTDPALLLPHKSDICCNAISDNRRLLATIDDKGLCCLVRPPSDNSRSLPEITTFATNMTQPIATALSSDGTTLAVADLKSNIWIFDLAKKERVVRVESSAPALKMAFTSDRQHLIVVSRKRHATAWNATSGARAQHQELDSNGDVRVAAVQDSVCAIVAAKQIFVRDALNPTWAGLSLSHDQGVLACSVSPDRSLILSSCQDGIARVWLRSTGKVVSATPKRPRWARSVAFSADGAKFATGAEDGTAQIWWTAVGSAATSAFSHGSRVTGVTFSPDGHYLVTTSGDLGSSGGESVLRVWDASNGDPICSRSLKQLAGRFPAPSQADNPWFLTGAFFSADGESLNVVTASKVVAGIDLRPDTRSWQDLQHQVGVRSGLQFDSAGGLSLIDADQVISMWKSQTNTY
jgi:eukaryotic-like serine/threonine-protein kinase